jgi:DNA-damage-inducible protein D
VIRKKYGIKGRKPIVDKAPKILITAQSLANQMTALNVDTSKTLNTDQAISREHITNNQSVRNTLIERGIVPENLPPEEDTKKLPKKIQTFEEGL